MLFAFFEDKTEEGTMGNTKVKEHYRCGQLNLKECMVMLKMSMWQRNQVQYYITEFTTVPASNVFS